MRKQALLGLLGLLGMCCSAMAVADERPVAAEKSPVSRTAVDEVGPSEEPVIRDGLPGMPADMITVEVDPHTVFEYVVVGPDGKSTVRPEGDDGGVAGPGEKLIYENILGIHTTNFPTNQPVSDDISTIAPDGCNLTRYKFKVLGKVLPDGAGGAYTVNYALYTNCPLAVGSNETQRNLVKIAGTDGTVVFPDDGPRTIEHLVPFLTPVALPTNVYLGIRFNRSNCGTVIGAPAMTGFSGDIWDFPGFPCNGFAGGFPALPHASFWLQMYGTTNCSPAFAGYKCQKPSGGVAMIGANVQGVDDVRLIVNNCQMVGYEVVVRGVGFYSFDLRRNCDGQIVPGSERTFQINASTTPLLQVARFTFNPPVTLTTDSLFLGFKCSSNSAGVIIAGIDPMIGLNNVDYFTIGLDGCTAVPLTQGVHGAVNLAITCAGAQPIGACCDPHLTECNAGADVGKRCFTSADCASPGTCEAVCRQTTELNCPFPPRGQQQRPTWKLNQACTPDPFLPDACGVAACCHMRPNPQNPNVLDEVCLNMTKNQCDAAEPLDKARLWQLGEYCSLNAQRCPRNACLARDGSCYVTHTTAGCSDPFCCSDICAHGATGAFCCNVAWDSACVALAEQYCTQSPPNDQCAQNSPLRVEGALAIPMPGSQATNNEKATDSLFEPGFCCNTGVGTCLNPPEMQGNSCIVDQDCGGGGLCSELTPVLGGPALHAIWFKWVQPAGQTSAGVNTCSSNSPALDSILQVFRANDSSSSLNACNSLSVIGCNDDASNCGSTQRNSRLCLRNLTPGETYYVMVAAKTPNRLGQYRVSLSTSCSDTTNNPIPNDYCHNATPITDATPNDPLVVPFALGRFCLSGAGAGLPCTLDAQCRVCSGGSNAGQVCTSNSNCPGGSCPTVPSGTCPSAGPTFECPSASCSPSAQNDVWFNYTATCTGEATFSTCGPGSPNTNIAVYEDCTKCPATSNNSGFLACNQDNNQPGCIQPARVVANVTQGQCYKVRISDQDGFAVSGNLTITCPPSADCQPNGIPDAQEIANCPVGDLNCKDCNNNGRPDFCDIRDGIEQDCQPNLRPDFCDIRDGFAQDCQPNGIPDTCDGGTGGNCPVAGCSGFVSSVPAKCTMDARRPHAPNAPGTLQGHNSLTMTFGAACNAVPAHFTVTCSPTAAPCPTITNVTAVGATQTITLSSVIPAGNWTCVRHTATGAEVCLGSLPGDCDGNRTTAAVDILKLIDHLNGVGAPLTLDHCDMDRSAVCNPADITSLIDMLNGVTGFAVWNGKTLPVCPAP